MRINLLFLWIVFLFSQSANAQSPKNSPYEWADIPLEEIQMEYYEFDSSANAVVLSDYGEWKFKNAGKGLGYKAIMERHIRIKILTEDGLDYADAVLEFVNYQKMEKLTGFKAHTINYENGIPTYYEVGNENLFKEKNEEYGTWSFTFPKAKIGSILEYTYTYKTLNLISLEPWEFQWDIPVIRSELKLNPIKHIDHFCIAQNVDIDQEKRQWVLQDIPALREEPYVSNPEHYRLRMDFQIKAYQKVKSAGNGASVRVVGNFFADWESLNQHFFSINRSFPLFGPREGQDSLIKLVDGIIDTTNSDEQNIALLFNFVRDSIRWNKKYRLGMDKKTVYDIYTDREGSAAQMNGLLTYLLNIANYPADPILLCTRDHGFPIVDQPVISQFNRLITITDIGGKIIMMDPSDSTRSYLNPNPNYLNYYGWLVQEIKGGWIKIPTYFTGSIRVAANMEITENGELKGMVNEYYRGYNGISERKSLDEDSVNYWKYHVGSQYFGTEIDSIEIFNQDNPDKGLRLTYQINSSDFSQVANQYIYIDPMLYFLGDENPFLAKERLYPIDFHHLHQQSYTFMLVIPEGYTLESVPKNISVSLPDKDVVYRFQVDRMGNIVQLSLLFDINRAVFPAEAYAQLRQIYDHMLAKNGEQIVIKKISK